MVSQNRVQSDLILTNKRVRPVVPVPIFRKDKNLFEGYDQKARFSVMLRNVFTPSSYLLDVKTSTGRTRIFYGLALIIQRVTDTNDPVPISFDNSPSIRSLDYLEEKLQPPKPLLFQVVTSFKRAIAPQFS